MNQKENMTMTYSGIVTADGKKKVSVVFEAGDAYAEGFIPDCKITKSRGFLEEERILLEKYLQMNQLDIAKKAKEISGLRAFMK